MKNIYTLLVGLLYVLSCMSQQTDVVLNSPQQGNITIEATNSISLSPGFSFSSATGNFWAHIVNPYVSGPVTYNTTPVDPANRSLNTSYLVGSTPGTFDVNPAGGASYTIPIDVLPGVNGLVPSLSLVYSSNSGSGVAGYGWQIGGLSVITRAGQNYYNDEASAGVDLTSADRFLLDGQRLVPTSGNYGATGTIYQTESDIFTRVQSVGTLGTGPEKFTAQTKSGLKNYYGYTDEGKQKIDGYQEVLNWYITETRDLYGNSITYTYLKDNNVLYIREIAYGPNKVTFNYRTRTDATNLYFKGQKLVQQLLLDKIIVAYNGNVVKTYEMKYNYLSNSYYGQSVLNEVIEYGTGGSQLNSTIFSYQQPGNVALGTETSLITQADISTNSILFTGDFDGDGYSDIIALNKSDHKTYKLYLNDRNGFYTFTQTNTSPYYMDDMIIYDLNGDGNDDIIGVFVYGYYYYFWQLSNGSSGFSSLKIFKEGFSAYSKTQMPTQRKVSDFDGDGFNDYLFNFRKLCLPCLQ